MQGVNYHKADPYTEWRNATTQSNLKLSANLNQDKLQARINLVTNKATSKNPLAFTDPTDRMAATAAKAQRIFNADWYKNLPDRWKNITKKAYYEQYVVPAYAGNTDYMVELNPKGLIESGNLPIWNRPVVQNDDGTHSSEYSTSFQDDKGHEVLVPTVVNGKFLTPDGKKPKEGSPEEKAMFQKAWHHYLKTGENLGKFDNADDADAYSIKLHERGNRRFQLPIPDRDTWINNIDRPRNPFTYAASDPASYYEAEGYKHYDHFAYGLLGATGKIFDGMSRAAIWSGKEQSLAALKLSNFFGIHPSYEDKEVTSDDVKKFADYTQKQVNNISHTIFGNIDFWNQTHPSQGLGEKIGSLTGELIPQLPLYGGIEEGLATLAKEVPVSLKLTTGMTEGPAQQGFQNLSKVLLASPTGKFLGRRLTDAASGYLGSLLQNESPKENLNAALLFMGFGGSMEGVGKLFKVGSNALAKKFSAEILAQGGRPFQQAVTDEATHQLDNLIIGHDNLGNEIKIESKENGAGIIHWGNKKQIPYNNPTELQQRITPIIQNVRSHDPVKFDLLTAEKGVLNSLSLTHFGKTFGKLDSAEKTVIRIARANQVNETINEFPVHAPEIAKAHIESNLAEERKENPYLDNQINYLEQKYGQKFSSEIQDAEAEKIKLETGIKSPEKATEKIGKIRQRVEIEDARELSKAAEEEPRRYVQFKVNNLAYFRNPAPSKSKDFNYEEWLDGMSDEDFDKEVKDHIGNHWFFENPQHLMLWAYQYRKEMPKEFSEKIEERLQDLDPTGNPTKWLKASKNMERHLDKLADVGKLFTEGNVFRSSNFDTWGNRTKWQKQLNNQDLEKAEKLQLAKILQPLKTNFPQDVINASNTLKNLQMLRRQAINAGEDLKQTKKIRELISSVSKGF